MEALSEALQPYKGLVGTLASVLTIGQFFSGAVICKDIYKKKSTAGFSVVPFIGGITIGILMLKYSFIVNDNPTFVVNAFAVILNVIYTVVFYKYCDDLASEFYKPTSTGVAVMSTVLGYSIWDEPSNLPFRYGMIVTVLMLLLLGAPLMEVQDIIAKEDSSSIPFPITSSASVVTLLWLVYGIILLDYFMIVQNVIGFILCTAQLYLYFKYPHHEHAD